MNGGVKVEDDLSECTSPPLLHGQNAASPIEDKLKEENEREEGATLSPPNTWTEEEQTMTEKVVDSTQVHDFWVFKSLIFTLEMDCFFFAKFDLL